MNPSAVWIDCASWELDFFGLPHHIPWPSDVDAATASKEPFEVEHLIRAIDLLGTDAGQPWTSFRKAAEHFDALSEALEDGEIQDARAFLDQIETAHPGTSFRLFHLASITRNQGDLAKAATLFQQAADATPQIAEIWNQIGLTLALAQRRDEAVAAYRKALSINPQNPPALEGLAQLREFVKLMRDPKDPKSAVYMEIAEFSRMASKQIVDMGSNHEQLLKYGEELCRAGIVPEIGLTAIEKAHALQPDDPRTLLTLAGAYHDGERAADAKPLITRLTELFPDKPEAFLHLAQTCNALGQSDEERAALGRCIELNPNFQPALAPWFGLKQGDHDPAKEQELVSFAEERKSWLAYILAGALCRERGDLKRALRWAEAAVATAPEHEEPLLNLTSLIGEAREVAKLASDVKPKVESGKFSKRLEWGYAHALRQLGLTNDAIAALRRVAAADVPEDIKAACSATIESWTGLLTGTPAMLEVHPQGFLLRDVLLCVDGEDGGILLRAGEKLPQQNTFPWRAIAAETSVILHQGQSGCERPPLPLGEFKIRGIEVKPGQPTTVECHLAATPDGALQFRARQDNRRLQVGWVQPKQRTR